MAKQRNQHRLRKQQMMPLVTHVGFKLLDADPYSTVGWINAVLDALGIPACVGGARTLFCRVGDRATVERAIQSRLETEGRSTSVRVREFHKGQYQEWSSVRFD